MSGYKNCTKIGSVEIRGKVALAPLAGVTDIPFRLICKEMGVPVVFSEMVSSEGLVRGSEKTNKYLNFLEEERPIALQIFGGDPETMSRAAHIVERNYKPDIIDLNFGCPVKKVVRNEAGSAVLKHPRKLGHIVRSVVDSVNLPVTAKIRSGWDENSVPVSEIGKILEDSGISAITIHARTRKQQFSGSADWDEIKKIKNAVNVPVLGNGDVNSPLDAKRMMEQTGCDMVMIGRGAIGNPWIFRDMRHYFETGDMLQPPGQLERISVCIRHYNKAIKMYGNWYASHNMKKHIGWYLKGMPDAGRIKQAVFTAKESFHIEEILSGYKTTLEQYEKEKSNN